MNGNVRAARASAPAKVILLGEHAVVYGFPAIAVPVSSLRVFAEVKPNPHPDRELRITGAGLELYSVPSSVSEQADDALAYTVRLFTQMMSVPPPNVTITIDSHIPIAGGLGSGAAVTAALGRALALASDISLPDHLLNDLVYEVEKMHHGTPSGIDNTVIVYERPIYFTRSAGYDLLTIGTPFLLLIADTGEKSLTRTAVADVRRLREASPNRTEKVLSAIGDLVTQARQAIESGDPQKLGSLMTENHELLCELTVSSQQLDILVKAARQAGAWGAKLSGGGRGGNMIALVPFDLEDAVRQALYDAGAVRVFRTVIESGLN